MRKQPLQSNNEVDRENQARFLKSFFGTRMRFRNLADDIGAREDLAFEEEQDRKAVNEV